MKSPGRTIFYTQSLYYTFQNWFYYWKGYSQNTRYSFQIEDLFKWNLTHVATNVRNKIVKAGKIIEGPKNRK